MKRHIVWTTALLSAAFFALPASSRAQFAPAEGIAEESLSARSAPATASKESDDALKSKGYVLVGSITLNERFGEPCWGAKCSAFACPSNPGSVELTSKLLAPAAAHGGDILVLQDDNAVKKFDQTRPGKCTHKGDDCQIRTFLDANLNIQTRTVCKKICDAWAPDETGFSCSVVSQGKVWRLDPGLPSRIAARKEKAAVEAKAAAESAAAEKATADEAAKTKAEREAFVLIAKAFVAVEPVGPSGLSPFQDKDKWGYRDAHGNIVIVPRFQHADPFAEGLACVTIENKRGFIDTTGAVVLPAQFDAAYGFSDGLSPAGFTKKLFVWKMGFIDKKGVFVIRAQFGDVHKFSESLAAAAIGGGLDFSKDRWGYIDESGNWVIRRQFLFAGDFSGGLAPVAIGVLGNNSWGYINTKGDLVIKPSFQEADAFADDLAKVAVKHKYGYINRTGEFVIQPQFDYAAAFHDGKARVVLGTKLGFVDKSGNFAPSQ